ncbi:hypothetical protein [Curvivirga sp.]|uniref:hypothetical protein n=1 Tax=Curvivirga sp. TaxID=2856848 RepID=UPI003B5B5C3D
MKQLSKWVKTSVVAAMAVGAVGITGLSNQAEAAVQQTKIPVLVMGEDSDPTTVKRSSDIFKRVMAGLKDSMSRYGFRMMDEEFMAVELGWKITERRPKTELIEAAKLANAASKANTRSRAMVLFRVHATLKKLSFSNKVTTRIDGEIYDVNNNNFLGTFELSPQAYPAPADCDSICISEVVGAKARVIAEDLGNVLAKKLDYLHTDGSASGSSVSGGSSGNGSIPSYAESNIPNAYTINLKYFDTREALSIIGVMSDEFPGYKGHELLSKGSVNRSYEYMTIAKSSKLEEWITILLIDMGFDIDRHIEIMIQGNEITVNKLNATPERARSEDETKRFN